MTRAGGGRGAKVTRGGNPDLEAFIRSRVPMVEHDLALYESGPRGCRRPVWARRKYSFKHALFYQVEHYLTDPRVYASRAALDWAAEHWRGGAAALWTTTRDGQASQEGCPISRSGLHWEHVYTGEMFFEAVLELFREGGGRVDGARLQALVLDNLACAWVTREENGRLPKSFRGRNLEGALGAYRAAGIELVDPRGLPVGPPRGASK